MNIEKIVAIHQRANVLNNQEEFENKIQSPIERLLRKHNGLSFAGPLAIIGAAGAFAAPIMASTPMAVAAIVSLAATIAIVNPFSQKLLNKATDFSNYLRDSLNKSLHDGNSITPLSGSISKKELIEEAFLDFEKGASKPRRGIPMGSTDFKNDKDYLLNKIETGIRISGLSASDQSFFNKAQKSLEDAYGNSLAAYQSGLSRYSGLKDIISNAIENSGDGKVSKKAIAELEFVALDARKDLINLAFEQFERGASAYRPGIAVGSDDYKVSPDYLANKESFSLITAQLSSGDQKFVENIINSLENKYGNSVTPYGSGGDEAIKADAVNFILDTDGVISKEDFDDLKGSEQTKSSMRS